MSLHHKQFQAFEKIKHLQHAHPEMCPRAGKSPLSLYRVFQIQSFPGIFRELSKMIPSVANLQHNEIQTRFFLVMTFEEMFSLLQRLREEYRCIYEIIREEDPCFLYFDIEREYSDKFQKEHQENAMKMLMRHLGEELRHVFGRDIYKADNFMTYVVDMDSSTEKKFSRHVVVRLRTRSGKFAVWRDNRQMGNFVKNWIQKLFADEEMKSLVFYQERIVHPRGIHSTVSPHNGNMSTGPTDPTDNLQWRCIIDDAVYTKNRAFRLLQNSKYGKKAFLRITKQTFDTYKVHDQEIVKSPRPLMKTLVPSHKWFARSLVTCVPLSEKSVHILEMPLEKCIHLEKALQEKNNKKTYRAKVHTHSNYTTGSTSTQNLTHKTLDGYLLSLIPEGNAFIRTVRFFPDTNQLLYEIGGNRYCHNVGRQHKSNHVYYIARLDAQTLVQKCTDPDCGSFRSKPYHFPDHCVPLQKGLDYGHTPVLNRVQQDPPEQQARKDLFHVPVSSITPAPFVLQKQCAENPLQSNQRYIKNPHRRKNVNAYGGTKTFENYSIISPPPLYKMQGVRIPFKFQAPDLSEEDEEFYEELDKLERSLGAHEPPQKRRRTG